MARPMPVVPPVISVHFPSSNPMVPSPKPMAVQSAEPVLSVGSPGQQGPHEGPFVTEHTAAVVPDAVRLDELRIGTEQGTVLLIGAKTGEAEQRQGLVAGPLGREEVAVVHAAM